MTDDGRQKRGQLVGKRPARLRPNMTVGFTSASIGIQKQTYGEVYVHGSLAGAHRPRRRDRTAWALPTKTRYSPCVAPCLRGSVLNPFLRLPPFLARCAGSSAGIRD